eukprot:2806018-Rhodomonas_salina.1
MLLAPCCARAASCSHVCVTTSLDVAPVLLAIPSLAIPAFRVAPYRRSLPATPNSGLGHYRSPRSKLIGP